MFNRVYGLSTTSWPSKTRCPSAQELGVVRDTYAVCPGLHKLCLHGQQEIAVDRQRVRDRSDQERLNVSQVRHPHIRRRVIQRNGLAQSKACRSEPLLSAGSEARPADFFVVSTVRVTLHHVSSLNGILPAVVITCQ